MLTCKTLVDLLVDYLDGALTPDVLEELERHLQDCPPCLAYLNTYRKTAELAGQATNVEMPPELKARLRRFLRERLAREEP
jgi:anti-sigma factor (TIGR02949 family)